MLSDKNVISYNGLRWKIFMENNKLSDVNSKGGSELIAIAHGIAANFESRISAGRGTKVKTECLWLSPEQV